MSTRAVDSGAIVLCLSRVVESIHKEEVTNVRYLSDQILVEVYQRAVALQLDPDFIELIYSEMQRRKLVDSEATA